MSYIVYGDIPATRISTSKGDLINSSSLSISTAAPLCLMEY